MASSDLETLLLHLTTVLGLGVLEAMAAAEAIVEFICRVLRDGKRKCECCASGIIFISCLATEDHNGW
jgi:hypothetical protein